MNIPEKTCYVQKPQDKFWETAPPLFNQVVEAEPLEKTNILSKDYLRVIKHLGTCPRLIKKDQWKECPCPAKALSDFEYFMVHPHNEYF